MQMASYQLQWNPARPGAAKTGSRRAGIADTRILPMKRFLLAAVLTTATAGALAQVGVSVNVGQPGFYGYLDIGVY
jgi:hypothetical protein